ncbi:Methionine--tRNA ligase [uncultured archaeon]|nr:Methionine--tRNA ligase [uncultured archaeon]
MFDEKEKTFLSDGFVNGECTFCGAQDQYGDGCEKCGKVYSPLDLKKPYSILSKQAPVIKESTHLFFKLTKAKEFLEEFLEKPALSKDVINYLKNWLEKLEEWYISREPPYDGFKFPGEDKYFYVWWDAPLGYFAALKHYCEQNNLSFTSFVKNEKSEIVQFIGKDIVYHHYLFWPAMLHVGGYNLPNAIPVRGHLTLNGEKFSKSRGIIITPAQVVSKYDKDFLRFYLTAVTPNSPVDVDFSWQEFKNKVNGELIDNYGNLLFRVTSMIKTKCDSKVPEPANYEDEDKAFSELFTPFLEKIKGHYEKADLKQALETTMDFCRKSNKYVNDTKPWDLQKNHVERYKTVLYLSFKAVAIATIALTPIIPDSCDRLIKTLGLKLKWDESLIKPGLIVNPQIPFKKIEEEF